MHGVFLDTATLHPGDTPDLDFARLRAALPHWTFHDRTAPGEVAARIAAADVVVTNKVVLDAALLQGAPRLKLVCVSATGMNNVDLAAAQAAGIPVRNVTGYAGASVAQHTLALMLGLATQWHRYAHAVEQGDWARSPLFCLMHLPVVELAGRTLGIVGGGNLGRQVGHLAAALGMHVQLAQLPGRATATPAPWPRVPWAEFLRSSDVVSIHCPLTDETRGLFGAGALRAMKPTAFLVNTARGGIVDEAALLTALREGWIAAAATDVLAQEPPAADHPLIAARLPNLVITPHNAWVSRDSRQRLLDGVAANIEAWRRT